MTSTWSYVIMISVPVTTWLTREFLPEFLIGSLPDGVTFTKTLVGFAQNVGGNRNTFYTSYENSAGRQIDHDIVFFWEIMAYVRWATIALQQAQRFLSGKEASLEAALTGHVVPGLEFELLQMIRDGG